MAQLLDKLQPAMITLDAATIGQARLRASSVPDAHFMWTILQHTSETGHAQYEGPA